MTLVILGVFAAGVTPSLSEGAKEGPGSVPTEIERHYPQHFLQRYGEPSLWAANAQKGFRDRVRLSIEGSARLSVIVRIDESEDGKIVGRAILSDNRTTGRRTTETKFRLTPRDMAALRDLFASAKLWSSYPQIYGINYEPDICVDGEEMTFERMNADGYRFAAANAPCRAPPELLAVARKIVALAGVKRALQLLN